MRRNSYNSFDNFDRSFNRSFKLITGAVVVVFAIAFIGVAVQFAAVGYVGYQVISDPEGSADFVGGIAARIIDPVAESVRGE